MSSNDDITQRVVLETRATEDELSRRRAKRRKLREKMHSQRRPSGLPMASHLDDAEKKEAVDIAIDELAEEELESHKSASRVRDSIRQLAADIRAESRASRRRTSQTALRLGILPEDEEAPEEDHDA